MIIFTKETKMHVIAIVTLLAAMVNPLPVKSFADYNAKFTHQMEHPVKVVEFKFNN